MEASMSSPPNGGHAESDPWNQALVQVAHVWQMDHNLRHVQYCLQYLQATEQKLIHYLEARESRNAPPPPENGSDPAATVETRSFWDGPLPHQVSPPRFDPSRPLRRQSSRRRRDREEERRAASDEAAAAATETTPPAAPPHPIFASNNRFNSIAYDDDDDDSDEESVEADVAEENAEAGHETDDEAGDVPVLNRPMTVRRFVIRLLASQSDLLALLSNLVVAAATQSTSLNTTLVPVQATRSGRGRGRRHDSTPRSQPDWVQAAWYCTTAVQGLQRATEYADSQIAQYLHHMEVVWLQQQMQQIQMAEQQQQQQQLTPPTQVSLEPEQQQQQVQQHLLMEDADICDVAVQRLLYERAKLMRLAQTQKQRLLQLLQPQWISRDEIRERVGNDKWKNNPAPKNDYSRLRAQHERQLKVINTALVTLEEQEQQTVLLQQKTVTMKQRLVSLAE
jgi:hypothetical protein